MIDRALDDDAADRVPDRTIRQFVAICAGLVAVAAVRAFLRGQSARGGWLAAAAVATGALGTLAPGIARPVFAGAMAITAPIRIVVSTVMLAVLYYGIFTPLAFVFRLAGRDALVRRRPRAARTYWSPKTTPAEMRSYFRQS